MQFTAKEERLVIRSRKTWYKFSKFLVIILALIGTVLGTTIVAIMSANLEDRHQYQEQLTAGWPTIYGGKKRTRADGDSGSALINKNRESVGLGLDSVEAEL